MTERFIYYDDFGYSWFFDRIQEYTDPNGLPCNEVDGLIPMTDEQVVKVLNQLTKRVHSQRVLMKNQDLANELLHKQNQFLEEENQELKKKSG